MEPDPAIETNGPLHLETLALEAVIVHGVYFWGSTLQQHLNISGDFFIPENPAQMCFQYNNLGGKRFFNFISESLADNSCFQRIGYLTRYKSHKWMLIDDHEEIFDSENAPRGDEVADSVRNGFDLKMAILDNRDYWRICCVSRIRFIREGEKTLLESAPFRIQPEFISEDWICKVIKNDKILENIHPVTGAVVLNPVIDEQYVLDMGGFYSDHESRTEGAWKQARRFKVFRKKLQPDIKKM